MINRLKVLIGMLAALLGAAKVSGTTNVLVTAGGLCDVAGNPLPAGALVALVASATDDIFQAPAPGTQLRVGATLAGDDIVVALWSIQPTVAGLPGALLEVVPFEYGTGALPNLSPGDKLALYWFPSATTANPVLSSGTTYGMYRSEIVSSRSPSPWLAPADTMSANLELALVTTAAGGDVNPALAQAQLGIGAPVFVNTATQQSGMVGQSFLFKPLSTGTPTVYTATGLPVGLSVNTTTGAVTGVPQTAGSFSVTVAATNSFGTTSSVVPLVVAKGAATLTLSDLTVTYDGSPKRPVGTTSPAGLAVEFTFNASSTAPSAPGTYAVTAFIVDGNYAGTANATFAINGVAPTISSPPLPSVAAVGGTVSLTVTAAGAGPLSYQWKKGGSPIAGATAATLTLSNVQAADGGSYAVTVTNSSGSATSATASVSVGAALAITGQPAARIVGLTTGTTLAVTATGSGTLAYQWFKDGIPLENTARLTGARTASLAVSGTQFGDGGNYTVQVADATGSVLSSPAALTVIDVRPSHAFVGRGYRAGGRVTFQQNVAYTSAVAGMTWQMLPPPGWSLISSTATGVVRAPEPGALSLLEWQWATLPGSPHAFTVTLQVPPAQAGEALVVSLVRVTVVSGEADLLARPDPLRILPSLHSADENLDARLSLAELTRVIELYNTHLGTSRTGAYTVADGTEDGFAPNASRPAGEVAALPEYHSADSNSDGRISLPELTRVIALYNFRSGSTRTGDYHVEPGTEDGFAPGPDR